MKKKEPAPRPQKRNKEVSKKGAEEIPDRDELQALDEANKPRVTAWRKAVHKK